MKKFSFLLFLLVLSSCRTNKAVISSIAPEDITKLNYFEPFTYIQLVEKKNRPLLSDSLSLLTKNKLDSILEKEKSKLRLDKNFVFESDTLKNQVENEIGYMAQFFLQRKKLSDIPLTPTIDSIMEANDQRFMTAIVATGFGRKKGNYGGQVAKGAAVGLLTLGLYAPVPIKSNLTLYGFIFDSQTDKVAYFKRTGPVEKDPTDPDVIEKQVLEIFDGFFYEVK